MPRSVPVCSVVIPAYNEEQGIASTLESVTADMAAGEFEITVVCNGCHDRTAQAARKACPEACVFETPIASKTAALNLALAATKITPVVFLDADIKTSASAIRGLVDALHSQASDLAFGKICFNTNACSRFVSAFYKAWQLNPYFDGGKVGGFFALSEAGMERLGAFPGLINDDEFVRRNLSDNATYVPDAGYIVEPPRTLMSLIKVRSRIYRGNRELLSRGVPAATNQQNGNAARFSYRLARNPHAWAGAMVFATVAIGAHVRNLFLRGHTRWEQDQTARVAQS